MTAGSWRSPPLAGTQWGSISMTANDQYTIAGTTGTCGSSGDNGVATSADLNQPTSIHFGAGTHSGDVYIADTNNNRIQEVAAAGETQWGKIDVPPTTSTPWPAAPPAASG